MFESSDMDLTNVQYSVKRQTHNQSAMLVNESRTMIATVTLHDEFAAIMRSVSAKDDRSVNDVLMATNGFSQISEQVVQQMQQSSLDIDDLSNEMFTWRLLLALYTDRADPLNVNDIDLNKTCLDDVAVHERLMYTDSTYREMNVVRAWLENCAAIVFDDRATRSTLLDTEYLYADTAKAYTKENGTPDGPRIHDAHIAATDKASADRLLDLVFRYVRCAQMDKAVELCTQMGVGHLAALLLGQDMYERKEVRNPATGDMEVYENGNAKRSQWMRMAWKVTQMPSLPIRERAIYAALCGRLSLLLAQCAPTAMHDRLWAYVVCATLHKHRVLTKELHDLSDNGRHPLPAIDLTNDDLCDYSLYEVIQQLSSHQSIQDSSSIFTFAQLCILGDDLPALLHRLYELAIESSNDVRRAAQLRFSAHMTLMIRALTPNVDGEPPINVDEVTTVLWMYIRHLIALEDATVDLSANIAFFVSQLDGVVLQIDAYAQYCAGVKCHANSAAMRLSICKNGADAGLPMRPIVIAIVRRAIKNYATAANDEEGVEMYGNNLCSTLDWLLVDDHHSICKPIDLLRYVNLAAAYFLDNDNCPLASVALSRIPTALPGALREDDDPMAAQCVATFNALSNYAQAIDSYTIYKTHLAGRPSADTASAIPEEWRTSRNIELRAKYESKHNEHKQSVQRWEQSHRWNTESVTKLLVSILHSNERAWLTALSDEISVFPSDPSTSVSNGSGAPSADTSLVAQSDQLASRLRQSLLPQLFITLLHITRDHGDMAQTKLIADWLTEDTQLAACFTKDAMHYVREYVREVIGDA